MPAHPDPTMTADEREQIERLARERREAERVLAHAVLAHVQERPAAQLEVTGIEPTVTIQPQAPQAVAGQPTPYIVVAFPPATPDQTCACGDPDCTKQQQRRAQIERRRQLQANGGVCIYIPPGPIGPAALNVPPALAQAVANGAAVQGVRDIGLLIDDRFRFAHGLRYPIVQIPRLASATKFLIRTVVVRGDPIEITPLYFNRIAVDPIRDRVYPDIVLADRNYGTIAPFARIDPAGQLSFTTDVAGLITIPPTCIEAAVAWYVKDFDYDAVRYAEFVEARRTAIQEWIAALQQRVVSNEDDIARWSRSIETTAHAIHETVVLIEGVTARVAQVDPKTEWGGLAQLVTAGVIRSYELDAQNDSPYLKVETPIIDVGGKGVLKTAYEIRVTLGDQGENSILVALPENVQIDIGRGYYHPHVTQRGTICWGGYAAEIIGLHRTGRYTDLIARICAFLSDYNPPDAYQQLRKTAVDTNPTNALTDAAPHRRRTCMNCGTPTQNQCNNCGDPYCGCNDEIECPSCQQRDEDDDENNNNDDDENNNDETAPICSNCNEPFAILPFRGMRERRYCSDFCRGRGEPDASPCLHIINDVPCGTWTDHLCEYPAQENRCLTTTCADHVYCPAHTAVICAGCQSTVGVHEVRIGPDGTFCSEACLQINRAPPPQTQE